jgi:hypothetical protein
LLLSVACLENLRQPQTIPLKIVRCKRVAIPACSLRVKAALWRKRREMDQSCPKLNATPMRHACASNIHGLSKPLTDFSQPLMSMVTISISAELFTRTSQSRSSDAAVLLPSAYSTFSCIGSVGGTSAVRILPQRRGGGALGGTFFAIPFNGGAVTGFPCLCIGTAGNIFLARTAVSSPLLVASATPCSVPASVFARLGVRTPGFSITAATSLTLMLLSVCERDRLMPSFLRATSPSTGDVASRSGLASCSHVTCETLLTSRRVVSSAGAKCAFWEPRRSWSTRRISSLL